MNFKGYRNLIFSNNILFRNGIACLIGYLYLLYLLNWFNTLVLMFTLFVFSFFIIELVGEVQKKIMLEYGKP